MLLWSGSHFSMSRDTEWMVTVVQSLSNDFISLLLSYVLANEL